MKRLRTYAELIARVENVTCGKCGCTDCTIYSYPPPQGTMFCPNCDPAWLKSFLAWGSGDERKR